MGPVCCDLGVCDGQGCALCGKDGCVLTIEICFVAVGFAGLGHLDLTVGGFCPGHLNGVLSVCIVRIFSAGLCLNGFGRSRFFFCLGFCAAICSAICTAFCSAFCSGLCSGSRRAAACQGCGCQQGAEHHSCHNLLKSLFVSHRYFLSAALGRLSMHQGLCFCSVVFCSDTEYRGETFDET